jgi:rhamnopyranosyl-N-acetylglucosaminyl-diphospho-decaprenol beta-1,3/1,4-galactofuranosyltransferase
VVDNGSKDGTSDFIENNYDRINVIRLEENIGGSGGFEIGMSWAVERGFQWVWIMDDDAIPTPTSLENLLSATCYGDVLVPLLETRDGHRYGAWRWEYWSTDISRTLGTDPEPIDAFPFVGPLISSNVVKKVGYPLRDYFIRADDFDYAFRVKLSGFQIMVVPTSIVRHDVIASRVVGNCLGWRKMRCLDAPWKMYYDTRNKLYLVKRYVPRLITYLWFFGLQFKFLSLDLLFGPDRYVRAHYRLRAIYHGLIGRLGKQH